MAITFEQAVHEVMAEAAELLISKHRDYGPGNIMAFGELGVLVRANDKIERLKNLLHNDKAAAHEPAEDSWLDLLNYACIALMLRRAMFTLPLGAEHP